MLFIKFKEVKKMEKNGKKQPNHGHWDKEFETGKGYWDKAFASNLYKEIVRKRFGVVIPLLVGFSVLFFVLFTVQQFFKGLADALVIGNINFNFIFSMLIFPIVWLMGLLFLRYIRKNVYPLEDEIIKQFSRKRGE
jgi:uncharacterized membrane protein (DUF485 family)